jgi:predicted metal-dependent peptidase
MEPYTLADARYYASKLMTYFGRAIFSLMPIERPGFGTFSVDKHWRMYYDPELFSKWSLDELAGVVLHETMHLIGKHHQRLNLITETPSSIEYERWNIAADMAINSVLADNNIELPDDGVYPNRLAGYEEVDYDQLRSAEDYYTLLEGDDIPREEKGHSEYPHGSSATDGEVRDWENPAPNEGEHLSESDIRRISRAVAKDIQDNRHRSSQGNMSGEFEEIISTILEPSVDPVRELFAAVKFAVNSTFGFGQQTYRRRNPRQISGPIVMPANQQPKPEIRVIIDSSGSMTTDKDLALAAGTVARIVNSMPGDGVQVHCADMQLHDAQTMFRSTQLVAKGRGGTDMSSAITQVDETHPIPDVIVMITDGETEWPKKPTKSKLVVCLTRDPKYNSQPPDWATVLKIYS